MLSSRQRNSKKGLLVHTSLSTTLSLSLSLSSQSFLPFVFYSSSVLNLFGGKQGWKCPVALLTTCCGSKSLKVILIDSDFRTYPVGPQSPCHSVIHPVFKEGFF
jgi:hypothetical protein